MGRYAEALGILEFEVEGERFKMKPKKGENLELLKVMQTEGLEKLEKFVALTSKIIIRDMGLSGEDAEELPLFIEYNVQEFLKEIMIGFRHITKAEWEALGNDFRAGVQNSQK